MYAVKLPLNIGGKRRLIGELIDDSEVKSPELVNSGFLVHVNDPTPKTDIDVPIMDDGGFTHIKMDPQSVIEALTIMQLPQADALAAVASTTCTDALLILENCEANKTIRSAVVKRERELSEIKAEDTEAGEA